MMEHLSEHTSSVTNELLAQLATKIERTTKTLMGNIEVTITTALNQLAQPIEDFQKKLQSSQCNPSESLENLRKKVDSDLTTCTQGLRDILSTFQNDANDFNVALEKGIKDIIDLPEKCEASANDTGFGANVNCFVQKITEVNQQIAVILNSASMTLVHTRQLMEKSVEESRSCADQVVASTIQSFDQLLTSCQLIEM